MCGVGTIYSQNGNDIDVANGLAVMMDGLDHRGPDAAGAKLLSGIRYTEAKTNLPLDENFLAMARLLRVLHSDNYKESPPDIRGFVQTRYATSDSVHNPHNALPMRVGDKGEKLIIIFNGNIPNHLEIRQKELAGEVSFQTMGDTETLARFILNRIQKALIENGGDVREAIRRAVREVLDVFRGGYVVVGDYEGEVFAFKDQFGIRPLALGKKPGSIIMASENHFFPEIGFDYCGELPNGHLLFVGPGDALDGEYTPEPENLLTENIPQHPDCFEFVYLAKRESTLFGVPVQDLRRSLGENAMRELLCMPGEHTYDSVVSVPNGANDMRAGACKILGMSSNEPNGLDKICKVRSFMGATQAERERLVKMKFRVNPYPDGRKGNDLVLDDSIVRGTTMEVLVPMTLKTRAKSVQVLSSSPIVKYGDRYGIAMSTDQLVARDKTDNSILSCEQIERRLFCDRDGNLIARLFFPSVEGFKEVFKVHGIPNIHAAYFDGNFING